MTPQWHDTARLGPLSELITVFLEYERQALQNSWKIDCKSEHSQKNKKKPHGGPPATQFDPCNLV